jgi:hypothetical protein
MYLRIYVCVPSKAMCSRLMSSLNLLVLWRHAVVRQNARAVEVDAYRRAWLRSSTMIDADVPPTRYGVSALSLR